MEDGVQSRCNSIRTPYRSVEQNHPSSSVKTCSQLSSQRISISYERLYRNNSFLRARPLQIPIYLKSGWHMCTMGNTYDTIEETILLFRLPFSCKISLLFSQKMQNCRKITFSLITFSILNVGVLCLHRCWNRCLRVVRSRSIQSCSA